VAATMRALESDASGAVNVADAKVAPIGKVLRVILARIDAAVSLRFVPRPVAWAAAAALEAVWPTRRAPRGPLLTRYLVAPLADEYTLDISRARDVLGYVPRWNYLTGPLTDA